MDYNKLMNEVERRIDWARDNEEYDMAQVLESLHEWIKRNW